MGYRVPISPQIRQLLRSVRVYPKAEWDTGFPFRPKKFSNQYPANFRKSPKIAGFQRGFFRLTIALWAFSPLERNLIRFAHRGKPEFLSLLPRNCIQLAAKNVSVHKVLKFTKAEWDTGFPFRPKKFRKQYPANSRKTPKIAGFQRGFFRLTIALWAFSPLERNLIRFAHRGKPEFLSLLPRNCIQLAAKNVSVHKVLKFTKAEWDTGFPFRPKYVSFCEVFVFTPRRNGIQGSHFAPKSSATSIRLTSENRPKLRDSRGAQPLWLFFCSPFGALSSSTALLSSVTCASTLLRFAPCFLEITSNWRQKTSAFTKC